MCGLTGRRDSVSDSRLRLWRRIQPTQMGSESAWPLGSVTALIVNPRIGVGGEGRCRCRGYPFRDQLPVFGCGRNLGMRRCAVGRRSTERDPETTWPNAYSPRLSLASAEDSEGVVVSQRVRCRPNKQPARQRNLLATTHSSNRPLELFDASHLSSRPYHKGKDSQLPDLLSGKPPHSAVSGPAHKISFTLTGYLRPLQGDKIL